MFLKKLIIKKRKCDIRAVTLALKKYLKIEDEQFAILLNVNCETIREAKEDRLIFKYWFVRKLIMALTELRLIDSENSDYFDKLEEKLGNPNMNYIPGIIKDGAIEQIIGMRKRDKVNVEEG